MTLERLDDRPMEPARDEIVVVSCVRDEILRLPSFLHHYRELGVGRFLVVDNDSTDGTREELLSQPDVHLFGTGQSYADSEWGTAWVNELGARFAADRWVLTVDADEHLSFPGIERLDLRDLVGHLEAEGSQAFVCLLLDMYSDRPIASTVLPPDGDPLNVCPFFDSDGYRERWEPFRNLPIRGGPRARHFEYEGGREGPMLGKVPLVRWRPGLRYDFATHWISDVVLSETTGVLLHFKYLSDFVERVELEVARGEHWNGAEEYAAYGRALRRAPDLSLHYPGSVRLRDSRQLVDLGLALCPAAFRERFGLWDDSR